jgi:hypothetical protein
MRGRCGEDAGKMRGAGVSGRLHTSTEKGAEEYETLSVDDGLLNCEFEPFEPCWRSVPFASYGQQPPRTR